MVSWAKPNRRRPAPSRPAPPRRHAVHRPAPTRPWYVWQARWSVFHWRIDRRAPPRAARAARFTAERNRAPSRPSFGFGNFPDMPGMKKLYTCRVQNPDIPRAGRGGAAQGASAEPGQAGPEGTSTVRLAQETFVPRVHQVTEDSCPERPFGSTNSHIRTENRRGNKTRG